MLRHRRSAGTLRIVMELCSPLVLVAPVLAGCASFSHDAGMSAVNELVGPEVKSGVLKVSTDEIAEEVAARTRRLLNATLSVEAAVRVALLNNMGLQSAYNDLGVAEAVMVEASLPPSPIISLSHISTPVELDVESRIVADILALATLPARAEIAAQRFRQAQLRAAEETLRVAAETRRSYYRAVAAHQIEISLTHAASAAETAAKLAKQLGETGAMNKLDQAREETFHADVVTQLAMAGQRVTRERERLIRAMGLGGDNLTFKLPDSLPSLPKRPRTLIAAETEAVQRRVDVQIARIEIDALARSYGLTKATRFINLLEVAGVVRKQSDSGGVNGTGGGAEVDFQVPIFDFGEVRVRRAEETYMQAVNRLTEKVVVVQSEAREAYRTYRSSFDIAQHYRNDVLPLRKIISDETMLRYGAMQIDVFSLLTEARQRVAANIAAIEAQSDFWLASADLDAAVLGGGMAGSESAPRTTANPADMTSGE